jgi:hypothetical protein
MATGDRRVLEIRVETVFITNGTFFPFAPTDLFWCMAQFPTVPGNGFIMRGPFLMVNKFKRLFLIMDLDVSCCHEMQD